VKVELAVLEGSFKTSDELAAKHATEHLDGKKESIAWLDPARAIGRQTTGGNDAMDMRVKAKFLVSGVENAEEANLSAEMFGIASDFQKGFRTGAKQKIIDDLLVLQSQWC
jgi:hypothetical protein